MQTDALAEVYARSLYELAEEAAGSEKIAEVGAELAEICELGRSDRDFREFLASPIIEKNRRGEALGRIFRNQITDLTLRFLLVVNDKGRLGHLEVINTAFDQLVQEAHGRIEVDVYSATTLNAEQLKIVTDRVREEIGKEPVLHPYTDESMLGGLKLRIGDQLIDGSVATRLRLMKQNFMTSGAATIRERFSRIIDEGGAT